MSVAGITVPGDDKSVRDRIISAIVQRAGRAIVQDKTDEYRFWASSGLDWTLVRPPRLTDGDGGAQVEHAASTSPRRTRIDRVDLARFLADCLERDLDVGAAPLVAGA